MKWTFIIQQKVKVALLLGSIMLLVALVSIVERSYVRDLDKSVSSIYYDRLIPATDIFYMAEHLFYKRMLIERLLLIDNADTLKEIQRELKRHGDSLTSIIGRYEKTYLVQKEVVSLNDLKRRFHRYEDAEQQIVKEAISGSIQNARTIYLAEGKTDLLHTIKNLEELTLVQSSVGTDLFRDSKGMLSTSDLLLSLQIGLAIIIGILVQALIFASKMVNVKKEDFTMN